MMINRYITDIKLCTEIAMWHTYNNFNNDLRSLQNQQLCKMHSADLRYQDIQQICNRLFLCMGVVFVEYVIG